MNEYNYKLRIDVSNHKMIIIPNSLEEAIETIRNNEYAMLTAVTEYPKNDRIISHQIQLMLEDVEDKTNDEVKAMMDKYVDNARYFPNTSKKPSEDQK